MRTARIATLTFRLVLFIADAALSALIDLESFEAEAGDPDLALGSYTHPAGGLTRDLTVGVGSAAYRDPFDIFPFSIFDWPFSQSRRAVVDAFWTLSDMGPNFQCDEAMLVIALAPATACPGVPGVV